MSEEDADRIYEWAQLTNKLTYRELVEVAEAFVSVGSECTPTAERIQAIADTLIRVVDAIFEDKI